MDTFIILGSLNAKKEDRELSRIEMKPFQLFRKGDFIDVDFFNNWGDLGISSLDWDESNPYQFYICTGNNLYLLDIELNTVTEIKINNL